MEKDLQSSVFGLASSAEGVHSMMEECLRVMDSAHEDMAHIYSAEDRASEWYEEHMKTVFAMFFVSLIAMREQMDDLARVSADLYAISDKLSEKAAA